MEKRLHYCIIGGELGSDQVSFRKVALDETVVPQFFDMWRIYQVPSEHREGSWLQRRFPPFRSLSS
jgi:hypothetical protein